MIKINGFFVFVFANWILCSYAQLEFSQFEEDCVEEHNKFRVKHHSPRLILNRNLCKFAKQWANHLAKTNSLSKRPNNTYGENLYRVTDKFVRGKTAVDAWYNRDVGYYDYNNPGFSTETGRFTQVVWKSTKYLGCAIAHRGNRTWVVANYDPAGNLEGQFPQNVLRP